MANRRALDAAARARLSSDVKDGASLTEAAVVLGVSYKTVQKAAAELGLRAANRARPQYTDLQRQQAVQAYVDGQSTGEVARSMGVSDTWVQAQLKRAGVQVRTRGLPTQSSADIAARYVAGESTGNIARDLGLSDVAVCLHLRRHGVPVRPGGWATRIYPLLDAAFDQVTEASAYWAGFLMADGCVSDAGRITLALQVGDVDHVRAWLGFLGSPDRPVSLTENKARAQVSSPRITAALAMHGVVPRKTNRGLPASKQLALHPAFWRGMVDGDGTISFPKGKHGPAVGLVGSAVLMNQYADFLRDAVLDGFRPRVLAVSGTEVIKQVKVEGRRARAVVATLWSGVDLNGDAVDHGPTSAPALDRKLPRARAALAWLTWTEANNAPLALRGTTRAG